MLFKLLGLPLSLPAAGLRFCLNQVLEAAEAQLADDTPVKEALLELQLRLEEGEIDEEQYLEEEAALMQRLREIRAYREARLREHLAAQDEMAESGAVSYVVEQGWDEPEQR
jgi:hypothetical protein